MCILFFLYLYFFRFCFYLFLISCVSDFLLKPCCFHSVPSHIYIVRSPVSIFIFFVLFTLVVLYCIVCVWNSVVDFVFVSFHFNRSAFDTISSIFFIPFSVQVESLYDCCCTERCFFMLDFYYFRDFFLHNTSFFSCHGKYVIRTIKCVYANAFRFFLLLHLFVYCIRIETNVYDSLGTQHHIAIG